MENSYQINNNNGGLFLNIQNNIKSQSQVFSERLKNAENNGVIESLIRATKEKITSIKEEITEYRARYPKKIQRRGYVLLLNGVLSFEKEVCRAEAQTKEINNHFETPLNGKKKNVSYKETASQKPFTPNYTLIQKDLANINRSITSLANAQNSFFPKAHLLKSIEKENFKKFLNKYTKAKEIHEELILLEKDSKSWQGQDLLFTVSIELLWGKLSEINNKINFSDLREHISNKDIEWYETEIQRIKSSFPTRKENEFDIACKALQQKIESNKDESFTEEILENFIKVYRIDKDRSKKYKKLDKDFKCFYCLEKLIDKNTEETNKYNKLKVYFQQNIASEQEFHSATEILHLNWKEEYKKLCSLFDPSLFDHFIEYLEKEKKGLKEEFDELVSNAKLGKELAKKLKLNTEIKATIFNCLDLLRYLMSIESNSNTDDQERQLENIKQELVTLKENVLLQANYQIPEPVSDQNSKTNEIPDLRAFCCYHIDIDDNPNKEKSTGSPNRVANFPPHR
jgi:methanogenic corrinoid protein MtbC1